MQLSNQRHQRAARTLYNDDTDPGLPPSTQPMWAAQQSTLREPWHRRPVLALHRAWIFVLRKFIFLLNCALFLLLLLLFIRFLLLAFSLHGSLFASWIFQLTALPLLPFNNLAPAIPYMGLHLDMNTLIAMVAYTIATRLIIAFLRRLFLPTTQY